MEALKVLEAQIIEIGIKELEALVNKYKKGEFLHLPTMAFPCRYSHMGEMAKLAHRLRSLLPREAK